MKDYLRSASQHRDTPSKSEHRPIPSITFSSTALPCSTFLLLCPRRTLLGSISKAARTSPLRLTRYLSRIGNDPDPEVMGPGDERRLCCMIVDRGAERCMRRSRCTSSRVSRSLTAALVKSLRNIREDGLNIAAF